MTNSAIEPHAAHDNDGAESLTRRTMVNEMLQSLRTVGDTLTEAQLLMLLLLFSRGAQTERSIAKFLDLREVTVTAMYPPLIGRGLVVRTPAVSDARVILSTAGHRFVNNMIYRQGSRAGAFEQLPVSDLDLRRRAIEALPAA